MKFRATLARILATLLCLLFTNVAAGMGSDPACRSDMPLPEFLSVEPVLGELVTGGHASNDASSNDVFRRYDLFGMDARPADTPTSGTRAVPGLLQTPNGARIVDITAFLASCPENDPATSDILSHIRLSLNGVPVAPEPCVEPVPLDVRPSPFMYYMQMLRVAYYMDQTGSALYPWTAGSYWSWMKERIGGIDIDDADTPANYCCIDVPGRLPSVHLAGPWTLTPYQFVYDVLAGLVLLLSHEVRHTEGIGHIVCEAGPKSGLPACDGDFDPSKLSAFGVAWWMARLIETGKINVGLSCTPDNAQIAANFLYSENILSTEFMGIKPPLAAASALPGGPCLAASAEPK